MYACMRVCMYACMHVCMYAFMHLCMYACMHVCVYVCMYVCVCMGVCMHTFTQNVCLNYETLMDTYAYICMDTRMRLYAFLHIHMYT